MSLSGPYDVLIEHVVAIANALDGKTEANSTNTGNRLRDALSRIADYFEDASEDASGSSLPEVAAKDNGKVLKVVEGEWAVGSDADTNPLPSVTASDNGSVLKVVEGVWAVGADSDTNFLPAVTAADNGSVLKVVNGAWAVASLEEQTPEPEPSQS